MKKKNSNPGKSGAQSCDHSVAYVFQVEQRGNSVLIPVICKKKSPKTLLFLKEVAWGI